MRCPSSERLKGARHLVIDEQEGRTQLAGALPARNLSARMGQPPTLP
jgi:hypothetical protein